MGQPGQDFPDHDRGAAVAAPYAGEGNHITAWAVYGDILRRNLIGCTLAEACAELGPIRIAAHTPALRGRFDVGARRTRYYDAGTRCQASIADAQRGGDGARGHLVRAMAAYLSCRQYGPLASLWLGPGQAVGAGEAGALRTLRVFESDPRNVARAALRDAIWNLLDHRALLYVMQGRDLANLPGSGDETGGELAHEIIMHHLWAVKLAYPCAYAHSQVSNQIGAYLASVSRGTVWPAGWDDAPEPDDEPAAAPERWSTGSATGVVVAATLADSGLSITGTTIHGRGRTLLSTQGHHMTAHVVFEQQIQTALVRDAGLAASRNRLAGLVDSLNGLATLPPAVDGVPTVPRGEDVRGTFAIAWESLRAARVALDALADDDSAALFESLSEVASAYLCVRNALPLAAVNHGGPANSHREAQARALLNRAEADAEAHTADQIHQEMWTLLYLGGTAESFDRMHAETRIDFAPGAPLVPLDRLTQVLATHRRTMDLTWPAAYALTQFGTRSTLAAALQAMDVAVDDPDGLAAATGFNTGAGPVRAPLERVVRARPKAMEDISDDAYQEKVGSKRKNNPAALAVPARPGSFAQVVITLSGAPNLVVAAVQTSLARNPAMTGLVSDRSGCRTRSWTPASRPGNKAGTRTDPSVSLTHCRRHTPDQQAPTAGPRNP